MDMAEAVVCCLFSSAVACVPIGVDGVVWTEVDHAKRSGGGRVEKKPPGVGRVERKEDQRGATGALGGCIRVKAIWL